MLRGICALIAGLFSLTGGGSPDGAAGRARGHDAQGGNMPAGSQTTSPFGPRANGA